MASVNPSAMLAESLSTFSKAAYQAFAEVEAQSRMEVARMVVDVREAKAERDKATRELHACQLEAQSWKQEIVASKAALTQAELTITHQAETLAAQIETIVQLRREVTQWKDQSRNWQEHFLRVEQERCAQSSRIDELVVEKLQYPHQQTGSSSLNTPKSTKHSNGVNSAQSSSSKRKSDTTSPTQPPAYKSPIPLSPSNLDSSVTTPAQPQRRTKRPATKNQNERERDVPSPQVTNKDKEEGSSTGAKRNRKNHANHIAQSSATTTVTPQQKSELPATVRSSTIIRRVQAIVHVKREESCSDDESLHEGFEAVPQNAALSATTVKKKEESLEYQRYLRTPRRKIVEDEQEEKDEIVDSGSDSLLEEEHHRQGSQRSRFRQRSRIDYREEEDDEEEQDDEDEDELMMGAEENHDEIYSTQRVEVPDIQRSKKHYITGPPPKKRKVNGR